MDEENQILRGLVMLRAGILSDPDAWVALRHAWVDGVEVPFMGERCVVRELSVAGIPPRRRAALVRLQTQEEFQLQEA